MVKLVAKELDSTSTTPCEDSSTVDLDGHHAQPRTITNLLQQIPRPVTCKTGRAVIQEITSRKWSPKETAHFYRMLEVVGTDFSIMANLQARRSKKQLLNKYKKEERLHPHKVHRIISSIHGSDLFLKVGAIEPFEP